MTLGELIAKLEKVKDKLGAETELQFAVLLKKRYDSTKHTAEDLLVDYNLDRDYLELTLTSRMP